jgi:nitroreductase
VEYGDLVRLRSAVRRYAGEAVEQEKLEYVLECARLAPSWANKQGWSFVVLRDAPTLAAVVAASAISRWKEQRGPLPSVVVACGDPKASGLSRASPTGPWT